MEADWRFIFSCLLMSPNCTIMIIIIIPIIMWRILTDFGI